MRITEIEAIALRVPLRSGRYWGAASWAEDQAPIASARPAHDRFTPTYDSTVDTVIVRLETDSGLVGFGEAKAPVAPEVTRDVILRLLRDVLIGKDPRDIVPLWDRQYATMWLRGHRTGFLLEAMAGVDTALWDLIGKHTGESLGRLLGGRYRDNVPVYASGIPARQASQAIEDEVRRLCAAGHRGMKIGGGQGVDADIAAAEAARHAAPDGVRLYLDAAARYDYAQAVHLARDLDRIGIGWLEAPLPAENIDEWARLRTATSMPIATDLLVNRWDVLEYLKRGACDVIQPDVSRAAGLTECRRIADITTAFGQRIVPHISIGSIVHVAASVHYASTLPVLEMMEFWVGDNPLNDPEFGSFLAPENGFIAVPDGPGLGIELDWDRLTARASAA
jgi:L-alanine-DL-glutamate epimerase-like enolase superfamily enzyme